MRQVTHSVMAISIFSILTPPPELGALPLINDMFAEYMRWLNESVELGEFAAKPRITCFRPFRSRF